MKNKVFSVSGKLEIFKEVVAAWTYLPIPLKYVPDVDPGGWGAIPIEVSLNKSTWRTSMFPLAAALPNKKSEGYFIPIKKLILKKENLKLGDKVTVKYFTTRTNL